MTTRWGWAVAAIATIACSKKNGDDKSNDDVAKVEKPVFHCLKVDTGYGRVCAGPGWLPSKSREDTFESPEAWCVLMRVSWADRRSRLVCVPTERECVTDIFTAKNGKPRMFNRTECRRITTAEWTHDPTEWHGRPGDGFLCKADEYGKKLVRCSATPGDLISSSDRVTGKAWCYGYTSENNPKSILCFEHEDDCEAQRRDDASIFKKDIDAKCALEGPQPELDAFAKDFLKE